MRQNVWKTLKNYSWWNLESNVNFFVGHIGGWVIILLLISLWLCALVLEEMINTLNFSLALIV